MALLAASSAGTTPSDATSAPAPTQVPAKEHKICQDEPETGSLISKRTCHTKAEWAAINKGYAHDTDAFRNKSMQAFKTKGW
jgi:hypothetical protein